MLTNKCLALEMLKVLFLAFQNGPPLKISKSATGQTRAYIVLVVLSLLIKNNLLICSLISTMLQYS